MSAVYFGGRIVDEGEARVALDDRGLLYGDGLFETLRVYRGAPFRLDEHVARMAASAAELGMAMPEKAGALAVACLRLVAANSVADGVLRIELTRGAGRGVLPPRECRGLLFATATSGGLYPRELYSRGARLVTAGFPRSERSPLARHKTLNYLESVLARREAAAAGADEAVLLNTQGRIAEAAAANVFLVGRNGALVTPPPSEGLLPGIARAEVLALARAAGIDVEERPVAPEELHGAAEAFLTNSVIEVCAVGELDGRAVGGSERPVTAELARMYRGAVDEYVDGRAGHRE